MTIDPKASSRQSRRDFVKTAASSAALFCFGARFGSPQAPAKPSPAPGGPPLKWRSASVKRLPEIKEWLAKLDREKKMSRNKIFRGYIGGFEFDPPKSLPDARSIVVLARPQKIAAVGFRRKGRVVDILIPTGYVDDEVTLDGLKARIARDILKNPAAKLERARLPLKTLANRCGLAEHGKNNITFVEGFGSFHALSAFYTDMTMEDQWGPLRMLRECKGCSICLKDCPTGAISESNFVIDVGKCLTLYNEIPEAFPAWLEPKVHHTLVGCLRCQRGCPPNAAGIASIEKLADLSEEESALVLEGGQDKALQESIAVKLKRFLAVTDFPPFFRNARLAWANLTRV